MENMQTHLRVQRYNGSFSGLHVHVKNYEKFMDGFKRDCEISAGILRSSECNDHCFR